MFPSGQRLKEERVRLGLKQDEVANYIGCSTRSQINYENGERSPDSDYLRLFASMGGDVQYVITGVRSVHPAPQDGPVNLDALYALTDKERLLIGAYRACDPASRLNLDQTAAALAATNMTGAKKPYETKQPSRLNPASAKKVTGGKRKA